MLKFTLAKKANISGSPDRRVEAVRVRARCGVHCSACQSLSRAEDGPVAALAGSEEGPLAQNQRAFLCPGALWGSAPGSLYL